MAESDPKQAKREYICPFTPYIATNQRSFTCVKGYCRLWDSKKRDCGLKRE